MRGNTQARLPLARQDCSHGLARVRRSGFQASDHFLPDLLQMLPGVFPFRLHHARQVGVVFEVSVGVLPHLQVHHFLDQPD